MAPTPEQKARYNETRNAELRAQTAAREATGLTRNRHGLTLYVQWQASRGGWLSYRMWENKRLTLAQQQWTDALRAAGAEVEVVDMARAEQADAWLGPVA